MNPKGGVVQRHSTSDRANESLEEPSYAQSDLVN
jgi:hypothetical protein